MTPIDFLFPLICLLPLATTINGQSCDVAGICTKAQLLAYDNLGSTADCINYCSQTSGCNHWSYDSFNRGCYLYSDCPQQSSANCQSTCVNGEDSCPVNYKCQAAGRCQGTVIQHRGHRLIGIRLSYGLMALSDISGEYHFNKVHYA